jgi:hypothetical protein
MRQSNAFATRLTDHLLTDCRNINFDVIIKSNVKSFLYWHFTCTFIVRQERKMQLYKKAVKQVEENCFKFKIFKIFQMTFHQEDFEF